MNLSRLIECQAFPCTGMDHVAFSIPDIEVTPEKVSIVMISEATPANRADNYYARGDSLFQRTTLQAFQDAGAAVSSFQDVLDLGVYLTTAVKCGKTGYAVSTAAIKECSIILHRELSVFSRAKVFMLMGDVAIKAFNEVARREGLPRVIPAGSTYKIRGQEYWYRGARVFPSYLQAGPSFFIEKSKRRMIAEDINRALKFVGSSPAALV